MMVRQTRTPISSILPGARKSLCATAAANPDAASVTVAARTVDFAT